MERAIYCCNYSNHVYLLESIQATYHNNTSLILINVLKIKKKSAVNTYTLRLRQILLKFKKWKLTRLFILSLNDYTGLHWLILFTLVNNGIKHNYGLRLVLQNGIYTYKNLVGTA